MYDPNTDSWCASCTICVCPNLYHGDLCNEKHNIVFNVAMAWIVLFAASSAIPIIVLRGRIADKGIDLKEWLLRNALQNTRATRRVNYPKGVKLDDELVLVRDHRETDGKLVPEDGAVALCQPDAPGLDDVEQEQKVQAPRAAPRVH